MPGGGGRVVDRFFGGVDPERPAEAPEQTTDDLLQEIIAVLREGRTNPPRSAFDVISLPLPAAAGEREFQFTEPIRHLYVPNAARAYTVYIGIGRGYLVANAAAGQKLVVSWPQEFDAITVVWPAGADGEVLTIYAASAAFDVK